ncbi:MAG TPA: HIT family protein [Thermoanaerobaculia bacterium]|nr:HIT family protein [Thermoanaerobaculia bacterium]
MSSELRSCVFCTDLAAAGETVFENDVVWVLLHPDAAVAGHAMVVSKAHVENASELPLDTWQRFTAVQHAAERALLEVTGADRAILLKLGIQTPHLHIHIYPVSRGATREDVMDAIDGQVKEERSSDLAARLTRLMS